MIIYNTPKNLRFYKSENWKILSIKKLLVNPNYLINDNKYYYAVYGSYPNKGDYKIFKKSEIDKHEIIDKLKLNNYNWYIDKNK